MLLVYLHSLRRAAESASEPEMSDVNDHTVSTVLENLNKSFLEWKMYIYFAFYFPLQICSDLSMLFILTADWVLETEIFFASLE